MANTIKCPRCNKFYRPSEFPGSGICIYCYSTQPGNEGLSIPDLYIKYTTSRYARWQDNKARRGVSGPHSRNYEARLERARKRGVDMLGRLGRPKSKPLELPLLGLCDKCGEEKEDIEVYEADGNRTVLCSACAPAVLQRAEEPSH